MRLAEFRLHYSNEIHTCGLIDGLCWLGAVRCCGNVEYPCAWVYIVIYLPSFGRPMLLYVSIINAHKQAPVGTVPLKTDI